MQLEPADEASIPQLPCKKCGQRHTAPAKPSGHSTSRGSSKLESMLRDAISMVLDLCDSGARENWDREVMRLFEEAVGCLTQYAAYVSPHRPETGSPMKKLIERLEESYARLADEGGREGVREVLGRQIGVLRGIECRIYFGGGEAEGNKAPQSTKEAPEEDGGEKENDNENGAQEVTKNFKKRPKQEMMVLIRPYVGSTLRNKGVVVNKMPNASAPNTSATTTTSTGRMGNDKAAQAERIYLDSYRGMRVDDIAKAFDFDARYHYRKTNKCTRCAAASKNGKDCFFPVHSSVSGRDAEDKCTHCKRVRYKCHMAPSFDDGEGEKATDPASTPDAAPEAEDSTTPTSADALLIPSKPVEASATAPVSTRAVVVEGGHKRKAISEHSGSNRIKQRRTSSNVDVDVVAGGASGSYLVSKDDMLHQASRLNISFESFTDLSRRQAQSDRKHSAQEVASEELKVAYEESKRVAEKKKKEHEESMRVLEERRRDFEEDELRREESEKVCTATREWLGARSEWAGENLIEEATGLFESIEKGPTALRHIGPVLQRLRTVFDEFKRVQGELVEGHRFSGERAKHLYALMERIQEVADKEVPVQDVGAK